MCSFCRSSSTTPCIRWTDFFGMNSCHSVEGRMSSSPAASRASRAAAIFSNLTLSLRGYLVFFAMGCSPWCSGQDCLVWRRIAQKAALCGLALFDFVLHYLNIEAREHAPDGADRRFQVPGVALQ